MEEQEQIMDLLANLEICTPFILDGNYYLLLNLKGKPLEFELECEHNPDGRVPRLDSLIIPLRAHDLSDHLDHPCDGIRKVKTQEGEENAS